MENQDQVAEKEYLAKFNFTKEELKNVDYFVQNEGVSLTFAADKVASKRKNGSKTDPTPTEKTATRTHSEVNLSLKYPGDSEKWGVGTMRAIAKDLLQVDLKGLEPKAWDSLKPGMLSKAHGQGTGNLNGVGIGFQPTSKGRYRVELRECSGKELTEKLMVVTEYDMRPTAVQVRDDLISALGSVQAPRNATKQNHTVKKDN